MARCRLKLYFHILFAYSDFVGSLVDRTEVIGLIEARGWRNFRPERTYKLPVSYTMNFGELVPLKNRLFSRV